MLHRSLLFIVACTVAAPAMAQVHDHKHRPEELGAVEFAITCEAKARGPSTAGSPCSIRSATKRPAPRSMRPSRLTPRAASRSGAWR